MLNNDFSGGYPELLDSRVAVPAHPAEPRRWAGTRARRQRTSAITTRLAGEFAAIIEVDPWLRAASIPSRSAPVNFDEDAGHRARPRRPSTRDPAGSTRAPPTRRARSSRKPFVFVKNNAGTYGMGIMVVHSAEELHQP